MTSKILCFSGWAQKYDSLKSIFQDYDNQSEIIHFSYSCLNSIEKIAQKVTSLHGEKFDIICGWSLGGQIASRLIDANLISTKLLILLSTPFEFVKSDKINAAMPVKSFIKFKDDFQNSPDKTLKKFAVLSLINDKSHKYMKDNLDINDQNYQDLSFWLDELGRFSCHELNFINFPQTIIFQGQGDMVVNFRQSDFFVEKIKNCQRVVFKNCGHAPHINFLKEIKNVIKQYK
jgi:pimeloyl-ACP methyl ester carboxylesterase